MGVTLGITAIAGLATGVYGQIKAASDQASADAQSAQLKNAQADELLSREATNQGIMAEMGRRAQGQFQVASAGMGVEGAGIGGVLRMQNDLRISMMNSQRDAAFKAQMLRAGANIDTNLASDAATAGYIKGSSTLIGGAAEAYSRYNSYKAPTTPTTLSTETLTGGGGGSPSFYSTTVP